MANFFLTNPVVVGMLNTTGLATALGASPKIRLYAGTPPADGDAALSGNTQLAELVCSATPFSGVAASGNNARATFAAITADASADASGTATFFRILDSAGTTVKAQGDAGTSGTTLILNTASIVAGATVSITAATIDLPEG